MRCGSCHFSGDSIYLISHKRHLEFLCWCAKKNHFNLTNKSLYEFSISDVCMHYQNHYFLVTHCMSNKHPCLNIQNHVLIFYHFHSYSRSPATFSLAYLFCSRLEYIFRKCVWILLRVWLNTIRKHLCSISFFCI